MDLIIAKELELEKQLQNLEIRKASLSQKSKVVKLSEIATPDDIAALSETKRATALKRNAEFLRDLEMELGKLHTKQLCPIESRLKELNRKFIQDSNSSASASNFH